MSFPLVAKGLYRTTPLLLSQSSVKLIAHAKKEGLSPGFVTTINPMRHRHLSREPGVQNSRRVWNHRMDSVPKPSSKRRCTVHLREPWSRSGCESIECNPF